MRGHIHPPDGGASSSSSITNISPYLGPHHRYLWQLDDIRTHGVEDVLELVYHGDKSLHTLVLRIQSNLLAVIVMEPKSFNVPRTPPLQHHPTRKTGFFFCGAGNCSPRTQTGTDRPSHWYQKKTTTLEITRQFIFPRMRNVPVANRFWKKGRRLPGSFSSTFHFIIS